VRERPDSTTSGETRRIAVTKVVIDMSMSLDGFVAGPDDGTADPLGRHGGMHLFD